MRNTIRKIIREEMKSKLEDEKTFINTDYSFSHLISEDNETGDKLILIVSLTPINKMYHEFLYGFILYDKNYKQISDDLMTKRSDVRKYLPINLIGSQQIFPIIIKLTRKLLDKMLPDRIVRRTDEILKSDRSLERYEIVTKILIEYGYNLTEHNVKNGINYWTFTRDEVNGNNSDLSEVYTIDDIPGFGDTINRLIFNEDHHRRLKEWYESFKKEN